MFFVSLCVFFLLAAAKKPALEMRYNEFVKMVNEIGKDVKPAYTNSRSHVDRLKRSEGGRERERERERERIANHTVSHVPEFMSIPTFLLLLACFV